MVSRPLHNAFCCKRAMEHNANCAENVLLTDCMAILKWLGLKQKKPTQIPFIFHANIICKFEIVRFFFVIVVGFDGTFHKIRLTSVHKRPIIRVFMDSFEKCSLLFFHDYKKHMHFFNALTPNDWTKQNRKNEEPSTKMKREMCTISGSCWVLSSMRAFFVRLLHIVFDQLCVSVTPYEMCALHLMPKKNLP